MTTPRHNALLPTPVRSNIYSDSNTPSHTANITQTTPTTQISHTSNDSQAANTPLRSQHFQFPSMDSPPPQPLPFFSPSRSIHSYLAPNTLPHHQYQQQQQQHFMHNYLYSNIHDKSLMGSSTEPSLEEERDEDSTYCSGGSHNDLDHADGQYDVTSPSGKTYLVGRKPA